MRGTVTAVVSVEGAEASLRDTTEELVSDGGLNSVLGSRLVRSQWAPFRRNVVQRAGTSFEMELTRVVAPTPDEGRGAAIFVEL